jgi:hypothetical protein
MELYSFRGLEPQELPENIWLSEDETESGLREKRGCIGVPLEVLQSYGFIGPIDIPEYDSQIEKIVWNDKTYNYDVLELTEDELIYNDKIKKSEEIASLLENIDYEGFISEIKETQIYKRVKLLSETNKNIKLFLYDFDLKFLEDKKNSKNLESFIIFMLMVEDYSDLEKDEVLSVINKNNMNFLINIPDQDYFSSHVIDFDSLSIVRKSQFPSWTLENSKFVPPVEYPKDGKIYNWSEETLSWIEYVNE